jgi:SET domain-containing protein
MYRPLPDCLTIKPSKIEGLGLFAVKPIVKRLCLGVTHIENVDFFDGWIRTPLGGFINHSDTPNCEIVHSEMFPQKLLLTLRDIEPLEELTVTYTMYSV